jgi:ankyrin repeat protein
MDLPAPPEIPTPPLVAAAMNGDSEEVARLLDRRPGSVDDADEDDSTALMCAAAGGYCGLGALLLDRGADPDKQDAIGGYTALILATRFNYIDFVRVLVQRGASTTLRDLEGRQARDYARSEEIRKILAQVGLNVFDLGVLLI